MRVSTRKDGGFSSNIDKNDEYITNNTTLKEILKDNHINQANRGKIFGQQTPKHNFGFCKAFENVTESLEFQTTFKRKVLRNFFYTTLSEATIIYVTFNKLDLFVPNFIPTAQTQAKLMKSIYKIFFLSFNSWITDRKDIIIG